VDTFGPFATVINRTEKTEKTEIEQKLIFS